MTSYEGVSVPFLPRCIGRIHLYSQMWRYFDQGLYDFLIRYCYLCCPLSSFSLKFSIFRHIYKPVVKITKSKILTSLMSFVFVYFWHGPEEYIMYWSALNYFGITTEYMVGIIHKKYLYNYTKKMSSTKLTRIKCILASPLLTISAISNFYFFGGKEIGNIFIEKFFLGRIMTNNINKVLNNFIFSFR